MYQSGQSQSVDGGLPSKTPVSLLQELCMRRGISPKYDLLQIEGPVHEPTFVYRVTVGEYAANGSGQTKKKAKHAAAKAVLDIIIQGGSGGTGSGGSAPELSSQIVSPYDDGIPGNPVGALQELCMSRRWPPPTYELTAEEGFPHERTFSICCTIGNHKEIGAGKSKKLSKRQASNKMLLKLKDQPVDHPQMNVLADDDDEVNKDSAYPVAGGSCPSLTNACTKAPFSILHPKRVCPHISDVFNSGSYQVCENCFKVVREIERRGGVSVLRASFPHDVNNLNGATNSPTGDSKVIVFSDENENIVCKPYLDLGNRSVGIDDITCCYTDRDLGKLEEMFDKLIGKHEEEMSKEQREVNGNDQDYYNSGISPDPFHDDGTNEVRVKGEEKCEEYERCVPNGEGDNDDNNNIIDQVSALQAQESNEKSLKTISTPRIIKGILHNLNFENVESYANPDDSHLYSSDH